MITFKDFVINYKGNAVTNGQLVLEFISEEMFAKHRISSLLSKHEHCLILVSESGLSREDIESAFMEIDSPLMVDDYSYRFDMTSLESYTKSAKEYVNMGENTHYRKIPRAFLYSLINTGISYKRFRNNKLGISWREFIKLAK